MEALNSNQVEMSPSKALNTRSSEFYANIGRKGGETVARVYGSEFFSSIGRRGGQAVSRDRKHMAEIGRLGGKKKRIHN